MYADLIAMTGSPLVDIMVLQKVKFAMKGGTVVKEESTIGINGAVFTDGSAARS